MSRERFREKNLDLVLKTVIDFGPITPKDLNNQCGKDMRHWVDILISNQLIRLTKSGYYIITDKGLSE